MIHIPSHRHLVQRGEGRACARHPTPWPTPAHLHLVQRGEGRACARHPTPWPTPTHLHLVQRIHDPRPVLGSALLVRAPAHMGHKLLFTKGSGHAAFGTRPGRLHGTSCARALPLRSAHSPSSPHSPLMQGCKGPQRMSKPLYKPDPSP